MTSAYQVEVSAPPHDVDAVQDMLVDAWSALPPLSDDDRMRFELALVELASNVIRHANDGSGVSCTLRIENRGDRIEATLVDSGKPGTVCISATEMPDDLSESGRGIPLIRALVDELDYGRDGGVNRWYIMRRLG
ncbi:ATP-binding protein [Lysobacter korlensis]|uniref:ATP-binding protein n=1 Tax=Lysobacter korlensis TaxID=553636 RepID=A0ABV6RXU5_9GAMM